MESIKRVIEKIKKHKRKEDQARGLFPASAADRWLSCPKSSQLAKEIPTESTSYSSEGQLAHKVCEAMYAYRMHGIPYSKELNQELMGLDDNGEEMENHANEYLKILEFSTAQKDHIGTPLYVEIEKYLLVDDVTDETRVGGMADYIVIGTKGAAVIDFKYGQWYGVGAKHPQLLTYLTALREIDVPDYKFMSVIYQPRRRDLGNPLDTHCYKLADLIAHYEEILRVRREYESAATQLNYGSHCRWCPAKRTNDLTKKCPIVDKKQVDGIWDSVQEAVMSMEKAKHSTGEDRDKKIKQFFAVLPQIMEYKNLFEQELMARLDAGEEVKGFKITERPGRRKWAGTAEEIGQILEAENPKLRIKGATELKMKTITAIEKLIGKGKLDAFTTTSDPSKKLVVTEEVNIDEILKGVEDEN